MNDLTSEFEKIKQDFIKARENNRDLSLMDYVGRINDAGLKTSAICFLATVEAELQLSSSTRVMPDSESDPLETIPNQVTIGNYDVVQQIGRGGFGDVYRAVDSKLGRDVAIKRLRSERASDPEIRKLFESEARIVGGFDHPNIVPVLHFDYEDEHAYIVSKFIEGETLLDYARKNRVTFSRAAQICAAIARALDYAHSKNIVHRDVKPSNIMVDQNGEIWLMDFGLGFSLAGPRRKGDGAGTVTHMSPEQASGKGQLLDGRADVFSLGVVLYELLTHQNPFASKSVDQVLMLIREAAVRPCRQTEFGKNVPAAIEDACLKALQRSPEDRFRTAGDFADALEAAATYVPEPIDVSKITMSEQLEHVIPELAKNTHEVWATQRISEGWQVGDRRDDKTKTHPDLVPYEQLTEVEREYDSIVVSNVIKALIAMGFELKRSEEDS